MSIPTIYELLDTTKEEVTEFVQNQNQYFVNYSIRKSDGKRLRFINAPKGRYKIVLENVLNKVLYKFKPHKIAHGFVFLRGPKTNAEQHLGAHVICKFDLRNFFNSITVRPVIKVLFGILLNPRFNNVSWIATNDDCVLLAKFLCYHGKVPQGAPTSPALSNLVSSRMDQLLYTYASVQHDYVVTRYADDITVSCKHPLSATELADIQKNVRTKVKVCGFALQNKKTKIKTKKSKLTVTGVVVNSVLNLDAKKYGILRAAVHNYVTGKTVLTEQETQALGGKLAWLEQLNPAKAKPLISLFSQYRKSLTQP